MLKQPIEFMIRLLGKELLFPYVLVHESLHCGSLIHIILIDIACWIINLDLNRLSSNYRINLCKARRPVHVRLRILIRLLNDVKVVQDYGY